MLLRKLSCLLVPAILAASMAPNGGAQPAPAVDPRFAFADTTLLRDTLGIHFDRLFELADSLRLTPDTLRALSIRQGFTPLEAGNQQASGQYHEAADHVVPEE